MPTYEFKCSDKECDYRFETPVTKQEFFCQVCGSPMVRVYSFATVNMPTQAGRTMGRR